MNIETFRDDFTGMEMHSTVLSSGMKAYFFPTLPIAQIAMYNLFTRFGSIDSRFRAKDGNIIEVEDGTAHFLEHCAFYDPQGNDALQWFAKKALQGNAWTFFDHTNYNFNSTGKNTKRNLEFLIKFVTTPYLTEEVVKKEQGVIAQEVTGYADDADQVIMENIRKALFKEHPVRRSIGGTKQGIMKITGEYLQFAYDTFYHPSNLNLVMMVPSSDGLKDAKKHFLIAEEACSKRNFTPKSAPEYIYTEEPAEVSQKMIIEDGATEEPMILIGFKGIMNLKGTMEERLKADIANDMLCNTLFSSSSEAVYRLHEKQAININKFYAGQSSGRGYGYFQIFGKTEDASRFEEEVIKMIKEQVNGGLSKDFFETIKRGMTSSTAGMPELESPDSFKQGMIMGLAAGYNPLLGPKTLLSVTYEDILAAGKRFLDTDNYAVAIINPRK